MRRTSIECCSNMGNGFADGGCLSEEVSSSGRGVGRQDYFACGITTTTGPGRREQDGFRGHEGTGMRKRKRKRCSLCMNMRTESRCCWERIYSYGFDLREARWMTTGGRWV